MRLESSASLNKPLDYIFPNPPADLDPTRLDPAAVPEHVAVIMDGNGRWAKERGKNRLFGHKAGIEAVRETIRCASDVGVRYLTIYSFSSENWKRPQDEVIGLMNLFATTMLAEVDGLHEEHVRVMTIGRTDELPKKTRDAFAKAWEKTKDNDGMTLVVAVNYGGRVEMLDAMRSLMDEAHAAGPRSSPRSRSPGTCTRRTSPTPTCSSARAARCACRTSCCGRSPIPSSCAPTCCGPTSTATSFCGRFWTTKGATAASGR